MSSLEDLKIVLREEDVPFFIPSSFILNKRRHNDYKTHLCLQLVKSKEEFESSILGEIF